MQGGNFFVNIGKIFLSVLWEIIFFPIWWYSFGVVVVLRKLRDFIIEREKGLVLLVWMKNLGKPMYSQYTWDGIIISFFVRLFQIIVRGIVMIFWIAMCLAVFVFWLILPILIIYEIYFQLQDWFLQSSLYSILLNY